MTASNTYLDFHVRGLAIDPRSNTPILLLQDHAGRVLLPIWIGENEARAIAEGVEGIRPPRPQTHDLLRTVLDTLGAEVVRVDVRALSNGTFFADLVIRDADGRERVIDARPSDSVALAVRFDAPIRVASEVLQSAHAVPTDDSGEASEAEEAVPIATADDEESRQRLADLFEDMTPEDFGKYKM